MPKRYKLKFGGAEGVSQSMNTMPLIIGLLVLCLIVIPTIGLIGYFGFYVDKCQDKDENDELKITCPAGKKLTTKTCEEDCDDDECCEEYNCDPPSTVSTGYKLKSGQSLSTSSFKSISGFPADISSKVDCDTNYTGTAAAVSCAGNNDDKWTFSGCELSGIESCATGANPHDYGHPGTTNGPRTGINDCSEIHLSHNPISDESDNSIQQQACDRKYQNNGRFCQWISRTQNRCATTTTSCALP